MLREHYLCGNEQDKSVIKPLVIPIGVKVTPEIQRRIDKYYAKLGETREKEQRRNEVRIRSTKNAIKQIDKLVNSWSDVEKPKDRFKKSETLEKLLKPIKEPKHGWTLSALAGYFYRDEFDLDGFKSNDNRTAKIKTRKLIQNLKNRKPEGLQIIAVKFTDPLLGITEYVYLNGFWNDSLIQMEENHKKKVREGIERNIKNAMQYFSISEQERQEHINDFQLQMEYESRKAQKKLRDIDNYRNLEWWRIGYRQSKMWRDRFMGKVPYKGRPERAQVEQTIEELNKPYRLVDVLNGEKE